MPLTSISVSLGARPLRHQHQRLVDRRPGRGQLRRRAAELGAHQVRREPEPAVGGLRVGAREGDPARGVQPEHAVADPRRAHQRRVVARVGERALGDHPRQVVGARQVGQLEPARRARAVQVGRPLDDRDHPAVPRHRDGLRPHRDAGRPVGVALPVDAPLDARRVEHRPLSRRDLGAHHVVGERGRPGRRPHLRHRHPARVERALGRARRHPQDEVGERQVGEELPVRHEGVQPLQVGPDRLVRFLARSVSVGTLP